jgi:hypothetical protein
VVADRAFTFSRQRPIFHRARRLIGDELNRLLDRLSRLIVRVLERRGLLVADPEHPSLDCVPDSSLAHLQAASVVYRIAIGPQAGRKALPPRTEHRRWTRHRATRYWPAWSAYHCTPPPFAKRINAAARNTYAVASPGRRLRLGACREIACDGRCLPIQTPIQGVCPTSCWKEPLDFVARLAALVPRPRLNLTRIRGVSAPGR